MQRKINIFKKAEALEIVSFCVPMYLPPLHPRESWGTPRINNPDLETTALRYTVLKVFLDFHYIIYMYL